MFQRPAIEDLEAGPRHDRLQGVWQEVVLVEGSALEGRQLRLAKQSPEMSVSARLTLHGRNRLNKGVKKPAEKISYPARQVLVAE